MQISTAAISSGRVEGGVVTHVHVSPDFQGAHDAVSRGLGGQLADSGEGLFGKVEPAGGGGAPFLVVDLAGHCHRISQSWREVG